MKNKKVVAIIQARMGSTRLPGKVMAKIGTKTVLEILVNRLKRSTCLDDIIIATTKNKMDNKIVNISQKIGVKSYQGNENDVLARYVESSEMYDADIVVRVTADNPLTDPKLTDKLIKFHLKNDADFTYCEDTPLGISVEIINKKALKIANENANSNAEREHVTLYFRKNPQNFKIQKFKSFLDNENIRLTVDTKQDLELIKKIHQYFGNLENIKIENIIDFLHQNPEICKTNSHIEQLTSGLNLKKSKISVIIRTHDSEKYVGNAIDSVLNQTLSEEIYEIIVVDDGSVDGTKDILKKYGDKIRIIEGKDLGPIMAINIGIQNSNGEYFILLDSDDIFEANALEEFMNFIKFKDVDFVYSDYYEINVEKNELKLISLKDNIYNSVAGGILFRKFIVEELGGYDEDLFFAEYDLLIKLQKKKYKYGYIPKPLFKYFRHQTSLTANKAYVKKGFQQLYKKHGKIKNLRKY